jgi:hypothetical protein
MRQGIGTPLPGPDVQELALAVRAHAASPDEEALSRCADLFKRLPEHLRFGPPLQFGEIGWMVDDVLVNHDTWAY